MAHWLLGLLLLLDITLARAVTDRSGKMCRDRLGFFRPEHFSISTCSLCYIYLVTDIPAFSLSDHIKYRHFHDSPYHLIQTSTNTTILPSVDNQTSVDIVCETISGAICIAWLKCCESARDCCEEQLTRQAEDSDDSNVCPHTFDGWDCWKIAEVNTTVSQQCPSFLTEQDGFLSYKTCGVDGRWEVDTSTGLEYTNYDNCSKSSQNLIYKTALLIGMVFNTCSIASTLPAIVILICYKSLRRQQRIKIHINLFVSCLLTGISCLIWDVCIRLDRLQHDHNSAILYTNQIFCKAVHILHRFARTSIFFWMSCEGFYLHRLLVDAFTPPKHFYGYIIYGWGKLSGGVGSVALFMTAGVPVVLCILYSVIRKFLSDDSLCWILPLDDANQALDWVIVYSPTILCILTNCLFLTNILRLLLTKMAKHPNEPSNFRKAIKATSLLIPLFGIHQFCLIYRPNSISAPGYNAYEIASAIILNSQGLVVSLLLCFFNNEVQSHLKISLKRIGNCFRFSGGLKLSPSVTSTSRMTSMSSLQNAVNASPDVYELDSDINGAAHIQGLTADAKQIENVGNTTLAMKNCDTMTSVERQQSSENELHTFTDMSDLTRTKAKHRSKNPDNGFPKTFNYVGQDNEGFEDIDTAQMTSHL